MVFLILSIPAGSCWFRRSWLQFGYSATGL